MAAVRPQRRLTAIMATDIVGYASLIEKDEARTLTSIKTLGAEVINPLLESHGGRVVKLMGDGAIVEFGSIVNAVACAIALQQELLRNQERVAPNRRIVFRIGINLGDVVVEGDDIYGDGVNVAARLEQLAEPGGILVSGTAYDHLQGKIDGNLVSLGERQLKNIDRPVRVYRVSSGALQNLAIDWAASAEQNEATPPIAVLPFENLSGDCAQDSFARGLTEDLITALCKVPGLLVIAHMSVDGYRANRPPLQQIAKDLGVRYVVEGSIQEKAGIFRIAARLAEAATGRTIWGDRFDREAKNFFALQDEIIRRILVALEIKLTSGDAARMESRGASSLEAWLLHVQAANELWKYSRDSTRRAREFFVAARDLDPDWPHPWGGIAWTFWWEAKQGWAESKAEAIARGIEFAEKAIELGPEEPIGYMQRGNLSQLQGDHERAIALRERAVKLAPSDFSALWGLGGVLLRAGQPQRAVEILKQTALVCPRPPASLSWWMAHAELVSGHHQSAAEMAERAIASRPDTPDAYAIAAMAYAAVGRMAKAKESVDEAVRMSPGYSVTEWRVTQDDFRDREIVDVLSELLASAGLPR